MNSNFNECLPITIIRKEQIQKTTLPCPTHSSHHLEDSQKKDKQKVFDLGIKQLMNELDIPIEKLHSFVVNFLYNETGQVKVLKEEEEEEDHMQGFEYVDYFSKKK